MSFTLAPSRRVFGAFRLSVLGVLFVAGVAGCSASAGHPAFTPDVAPQSASNTLASARKAAPSTYYESVVYNFRGGTDGAFPTASVVVGPTGLLYGTTSTGGGGRYRCGAPGCGTVYDLAPGGASFREDVLYRFENRRDGQSPWGGLTLGADGTLYGTNFGRLPNDQCAETCDGLVFRLALVANKGDVEPDSPSSLSPLKRFGQAKTDGSFPTASVFVARDGALYGTTQSGGDATACSGGCGVAYKLTPEADGYRAANIHVFGGLDGANPTGALIGDERGVLYGTAQHGGSGCGSGGCGVVYKLTPAGGQYVQTVLYTFRGGSDGSGPVGGLLEDKNHALYGTTQFGGLGYGTVFRLTPSGGGYLESILYAFKGGSDGAYPLYETLVEDDAGSLYGTTVNGGDESCGIGAGCGVVFRLARSHGKYVETALYAFLGGSDGTYPYAGVAMDPRGTLYGTTYSGGTGYFDCEGVYGNVGCGTVFKLSASGDVTPPQRP